ncbi:MAG: methylenetetrahydrofolate reductase [NAD(P)H] [Clostridiales bacterium]
MKISQLNTKNKIPISFEVFPPKDSNSLNSFYKKIDSFKKLNPDFISVTYGAGGSKKEKTIEITSKIKSTYNIESMAHFTCIGHSINDIDNMLVSLKNNKIDNILALRGDPPMNNPTFDLSKNIFLHASDLISYINEKNDFFISAAAYVEGHPDSKSIKEDLHHLKIKVASGVSMLITQMFFDNRIFYDYVDRAKSLGINCPISASIMPIFKYDQIKTMATRSYCSFPSKLITIIEKYKNNEEDLKKAGLDYSINQMQNLIDNNVDGIHLYTMNRQKSTKYIIDNITL